MDSVQIPKVRYDCKNLEGGNWRTVSSGAHLISHSPYTNDEIARVPISGSVDVDRAVSAALAAFADWKRTPIKERSAILYRFRHLLAAGAPQLAHTVAAESGKTHSEALAGILKGVEVCDFALSLQNSESGGKLEVSRGVTCEAERVPLGVVAGITPFNFPAMVPLWMYPIALVLGNCFILKPSEKVSITSQRIGELILEAGFPKGVFSIVNGDRSTAEAIVSHPMVRAVAFVGSTPAAEAVYRSATSLGKRALCLGGAKNCLIIAPDADPAITVSGVVSSFTGCAGQRCMAGSLLLAVGAVEPLISEIIAESSRLTVGSSMGAIIDKVSHQKILHAIGAAEAAGAKIRLDGRTVTTPQLYANGNWLAPTVIDEATPQMECAQREIFGPVLTIIRVKNIREALAVEAALPFGNATSIFTSSGAIARQVADEATSGMIGINVGVPVPREPFSFGGRKASKFGSGDITGFSAVEFWSDLKKVTSKWAAPSGAASVTSWMS